MLKRKDLKKRADGYADGAISYLKCYPCAICMAEDGKAHKCLYGVKYINTCPVVKQIRKRLMESEVTDDR